MWIFPLSLNRSQKLTNSPSRERKESHVCYLMLHIFNPFPSVLSDINNEYSPVSFPGLVKALDWFYFSCCFFRDPGERLCGSACIRPQALPASRGGNYCSWFSYTEIFELQSNSRDRRRANEAARPETSPFLCAEDGRRRPDRFPENVTLKLKGERPGDTLEGPEMLIGFIGNIQLPADDSLTFLLHTHTTHHTHTHHWFCAAPWP